MVQQSKQYEKVKYFVCILDRSLSGESMALNVIDKLNSRLKFLHRENLFLIPPLGRFLCNVLIQSIFDIKLAQLGFKSLKKIKITSSSVTKQVHQVLLTVR